MENFGNYTNFHLKNIENQLLQFFNFNENNKHEKTPNNKENSEFKYTKIIKPYKTFLNKNKRLLKDGYSYSTLNTKKNTENNFFYKPEIQVNLPYITQKQFYKNQKTRTKEKEINSYFKDKKNLFNYKSIRKYSNNINQSEKKDDINNISTNKKTQKENNEKQKFKINNFYIKPKSDYQTGIISSYHTISIAGGKGMFKKINQDNYINLTHKEINYPLQIFGIFDGHGQKGHLISKYLNTFFTNFFTKSESSKYFSSNYLHRENDLYQYFKNRNYEAIKNLFSSCEKSIKINTELSGSTCNLIFIFNNKNIICANLGDSRAIMIKKNNEIIQLSRDHKPELKDEKERILLMEGRIERKPKNAKFGPYRIWLKEKDIPGLSVSRAFGDLIGKSVGVIAEPEINDWNIENEEGKCIVIASDGVWEFVSNDKVRDIVVNCENLEDKEKICTQEIADYAKKVWVMNNEIVDDITVTVIFF